MSRIEWTERTWNPVTGCNKVSPGCKFCYAETFAKRLQAMGVDKYSEGFSLRLHPDTLDEPRRWRSGIVFVNSMSDLFHENIPLDYLQQVFRVMNQCPQLQFQVLTKRADYLAEVAKAVTWTGNIWIGVSVENEEYLNRIDRLREVPAAVRFLSLEPLLGPLPSMNLAGIHWVIVGGESGRKARPMRPEWASDIRDQCLRSQVPFFFKQWGGTNKKAAGRVLDGCEWNQMPVLRDTPKSLPLFTH